MTTGRMTRFSLPPAWAIGSLVVFCAVVSASAQVVPATPTKFDTKRLGEVLSSGGATVGVAPAQPAPPPPPVIRQVTYFAVSDARQWTSNDGKPLVGKLIAFEEATVTLAGPAASVVAAAKPPPAPLKPTVLREGKVRLLVDGKAYEVPLERLSEADRKFVASVQAGIAGSSASDAK